MSPTSEFWFLRAPTRHGGEDVDLWPNGQTGRGRRRRGDRRADRRIHVGDRRDPRRPPHRPVLHRPPARGGKSRRRPGPARGRPRAADPDVRRAPHQHRRRLRHAPRQLPPTTRCSWPQSRPRAPSEARLPCTSPACPHSPGTWPSSTSGSPEETKGKLTDALSGGTRSPRACSQHAGGVAHQPNLEERPMSEHRIPPSEAHDEDAHGP